MKKITIISDTHGKHSEITKDLMGGDFLLHCGDAMNGGRNERELIDFCEWFSDLDSYKHKIFISGNHCRIFEDYPERANQIISRYKNISYLEDSFVVLDGIKIYGTPWQNEFYNWAFNLPKNGIELYNKWEQIPLDTNILISHSPPFGILDTVGKSENLGCQLLRNRIGIIKPRVHCFGHIHYSSGVKETEDTLFINASVLNEQYDYVNKPVNIIYKEN